MAYDYNAIKTAYQWLSKEQQQKFVEQNKNDANFQRFAKEYAAEVWWNRTSTPSTYVNNQNVNTNTTTPTNSRNSQVGTWSMIQEPKVQETPKLEQPTQQTNNVGKARWNLTYEQQQERLNRTAWLKDALAQRGITSKTQPTQTTPTTPTTPTKTTQKTTQPQTPKQEQWDYQDNSQARMDQIANNLNGYRQTMPQLFDDMSAFYNFFIKDKGRSQDQIDFLWDYFNRVQKYGKYDNLSPDALWTWIANGAIPEDYLNTLKTTDPQKYQEVMAAKQNREDTIKNESFLNDAATMAWIEWWESENVYPQQIEWAWEQWLWVDEDENRVDDRRENYASEEEQWYQKQIADLNAANLDIDNTVKHTYDDLVDRYPWASKATLMAMAQDTNSDLLREKENNLVELTRLQGYVWYMQAERQEMNKAGADSISQLRQNLSDYYKFSPQWIAELTQSQYAATNITLDQADTWNETQKQMALEAAITPIFEQYWDIIERSPAEVINDTIAYAKKNWVWLRQALEESFTKYLKEKPAYKAMQASMTNSWWDIKNIYVDWKQQSVWYNPNTQETKPLWYSYNSSTGKFDTVSVNDFWEWDYQKYRETVVKPYMRELATQSWDLENAAKNIAANMEGTYLWLNTCWYYVNDYIYWVTGQKWPFGSDIANKRAACTNTWLKWAKVWDAIVFDWTIAPEWLTWVLPEYWHVGIITWKNPDWSIDISSSISWKVQTRTIKPWDAWYKNIYGTRSLKYSWTEYWYWENPMSSYFAKLWWWDLNADQKKDLKFVTQSYNLLYRISSSWDLDHLINSWDFEKLIQNMNSKAFQSTEWDKTFSAVKSMLTKNITDQTNLKTIWDIAELITLKLRKESWAAISAWEWASWFESFLPWAWEDYSTSFAKYIRFEQDYLMPSMVYAWWDMSDYKPLFSPNSPYYKKDDSTTWWWTTWVTSKWTWNISWTNWQWTVVWAPSPYSSLFNQLNLG